MVWVGRDDNGNTGLTGASGALKIWIALMQQIGITPFRYDQPEQLQQVWVTPTGDAIVPAACRNAIRVPLALPHGLPIRSVCDEFEKSEPKMWDKVREMIR